MSTIIDKLDAVPTPVLFVVFIAVGLLIAFAIEMPVYRRMRRETRERASISTSTMIQVLAVFYAILVAFVIVEEWSGFTDAAEHVSNESAALASMYRDSQSFPPNARDEVRQAIFDYDRSVLTDDFDAVARTGHASAATSAKLTKLFSVLQSVEPQAQQSAFYKRSIDDLSDVVKARRDRINAASETIPGALFFLVVVVSIVILAVATLLNTRERWPHLILLGCLAVVISLNLALIVSLDHPFGGAISVSDTPLREVLVTPAPLR